MSVRVEPNQHSLDPPCLTFVNRVGEFALVAIRSQPDCVNLKFVIHAAKPSITAVSRVSISRHMSGCGHNVAPTRKSRHFVARPAAALVCEVTQRTPVGVLNEHRAAGSTHVITPASRRCTISKGRITAQHHSTISRVGLLNQPHRHGRNRYNSGHFSFSVCPPRHSHSNAIAEAVL